MRVFAGYAWSSETEANIIAIRGPYTPEAKQPNVCEGTITNIIFSSGTYASQSGQVYEDEGSTTEAGTSTARISIDNRV